MQTIFSYIENVTKFYSFAQTLSRLEITHICLELIFLKEITRQEYEAFLTDLAVIVLSSKGTSSTTHLASFSTEEELAQGAN